MMKYDDVAYNIHFNLKNLGVLSFDEERAYDEVISPFTRIYLVKEGVGWIKIEGEKITLEPGYLYLIPSFHSCSYYFPQGMQQFYVHFSMELPNGLPVYSVYKTCRKVKSDELSIALFTRLLDLNPNLDIPHDDPNVYQTRYWLDRKVEYLSASQCNETRGMLDQLFSRFIFDSHDYSINKLMKHNLFEVFEHIEENLNSTIAVGTLASIACLSKDHFIKTFKKTTTQTPGEYINAKRIEKAQLLLLTTDYPMKHIIEKVGFSSLAYFSRIFKKYSSYSPREYRKFRQ